VSFNIAPKALYHEYLEEVKRKLAEANVRKKKAYHGVHREGTEFTEKGGEEARLRRLNSCRRRKEKT
jgi:hypothetical protein